ncbi:MAG TPA: hypothetical protein RMH99_01575 [Sandaracinaceae bacterium LLY-WYZ-13_1]|nr:hypothetical protein [Sandaracinaceae bacterium LLY-WYZ-13_1]
MRRRLVPIILTALGGLGVLGCGLDVDADPAPFCRADASGCVGMDDRGDQGADAAAPTLDPGAPIGSAPRTPSGPGEGAPDPPSSERPCPAPFTRCGGSCVDLATDPANCGRCGVACDPTEDCRLGTCCGVGDTACESGCTDLQSDEQNCGSCGFVCEAGLECVLGVCTPEDPRDFD